MKRVLTAALLVASLSACVPLVVVGGVAVGAWLGSDPRPSLTIKDDTELSANISAKMIDEWKDKAHVSVNAFNGVVLLTGEVPDDAAKARAEQIARSYPKTRQLYNELVAAPVSSTTDRLNDTQLTTRVKSAILTTGGDASNVHIQVITERSVVYLMGASQPHLTDAVANIAASVSGVARVVKLVQPAAKLQN